MVVRPPGMVLRVVALLERRVPPALLADSETRRRSLLIVGTGWVMIIACVFTIPVLLATTRGGARIAASAVNLGTIGLALLTLDLLRRHGTRVAGHTLSAVTFVGILWVVVISGALTSPYWVLLVAVPILAAQMAGRAAGHLWTLLCLGSVTVLWALDRLGVELPRVTDPAAHTTTTALYTAMAILAVHMLSYLAEVAKDDAISRAEQVRGQLELADHEVGEAQVLVQQAVAASAAKTAFMATMSHELRTPLNAVIGYAEMLVEDADSRGLEPMRDDLGKIVGASQHLLKLIEDILDLSRVEAEKLDLRCERFAGQELAREVVGVLAPLARQRGDHLELRAPGAPIVVYLDRGRVRQILVNLIGNAIKFTAGGRITVEARGEEEAGRRWLVLIVEDTGIGIAPVDLARIFEPFTQVDSSPRRRYEGSGLGLSLSRRLAQTMGGALSVRSQAGRGSTFTLRLPAEDRPA
jgi:signal transduction histidine kinase